MCAGFPVIRYSLMLLEFPNNILTDCNPPLEKQSAKLIEKLLTNGSINSCTYKKEQPFPICELNRPKHCTRN